MTIQRPTKRSFRDRLTSARRGTSVLEVGLALPLLTIITFGTIDFGRVFRTAITVTSSARAGAQYGAQSNAKSGDLAGIRQAARDDAQNRPGLTVTAERICKCSTGTVVNCVTGSCGADGPPQIHVRVTTEETFQTLFRYPAIPNSTRLRGRAQLQVQ